MKIKEWGIVSNSIGAYCFCWQLLIAGYTVLLILFFFSFIYLVDLIPQ